MKVLYGAELSIIKFCGEEIARQRDSPRMVAPLVEAWMWATDYVLAHRDGRPHKAISITPGIIQSLHSLAMPHLEASKVGAGWRRVEVVIRGQQVRVPWQEVPRKIEELCAYQNTGTALEFYREFEEIHPFTDGNGRVGALLYNWMKETLMAPECPPYLWAKETT